MLTNEQTEKVLQFQDLTGIDDINVVRDVLIRHQWDLEVAIQEQLNIREGRPSMYATESRAPQVVNDRYLQHIFSNTSRSGGAAVGPSHNGIKGFLGYVFNYVFNFCYASFSSILTAVISLFRDQERIVTDPLGDVLKFIRSYNEKYAEHPVFYQGTYAQALNDAKRELKFLLIYLHKENNHDSTNFCRTTLANPAVVEYVNRNMFFWACDISSPEGFRVSHSINARAYPILVVVGLRANKMIIMGRMEGDCTPEEFLRRLKTVVGDNEIWLNQARSERLERSLTQSLRQQQDEAYEESLRADQEKERQKQLLREEAQREQDAISAELQAVLQRKEDLARLKIDLASQVPSEPPADSSDSVRVVFKFPDGQRIERRFLSTHSLRDVHNFVFCHPSSPDDFEITTNFPKRILQCNSSNATEVTLLQASIANREVLFINDLNA